MATDRPTVSDRVFAFIEHPLFLLPVGVIGGALSLISTPFSLLAALCILGAFHRAKVFTGHGWKAQVIAYVSVFVVSMLVIFWIGGWIKDSVPTDIAERVASKLNLKRHPSDAEMQAFDELDGLFAGKDENNLRLLFGFQEMVSLNIEYNKQRRIHYSQTGEPNFDITPYIDGRELQYDSQWTPNNLRKTESGFLVTGLDINAVSLLILPRAYSANKAALLKYENSSALPIEVVFAVKEFDRALQANVDTLLRVLNIALREDPNYFVLHDTADQRFSHVLEDRYYTQFTQLRPLADKIRDASREALKP